MNFLILDGYQKHHNDIQYGYWKSAINFGYTRKSCYSMKVMVLVGAFDHFGLLFKIMTTMKSNRHNVTRN